MNNSSFFTTETLDLDVLKSQEASDLFVEIGKKEVNKEITSEMITSKWKCVSCDMLTNEEKNLCELSMLLEPFTSEDAQRVRMSTKNAKIDYYKAHSECPNCHSTAYSSTYMGYVMNPNNISAYKDENKVTCKCGWIGIVHDLVGA